MSRKIYNRLSFMAVSWLDESTLLSPSEVQQDFPCGSKVLDTLVGQSRQHRTGTEQWGTKLVTHHSED